MAYEMDWRRMASDENRSVRLRRSYTKQELLDAADQLSKMYDELMIRGWTQGALITTSGRVCIHGAYLAAKYEEFCDRTITELERSNDVYHIDPVVLDALKETIGSVYYVDLTSEGLYDWNDRISTKADDVFDAIKGAEKCVTEIATTKETS